MASTDTQAAADNAAIDDYRAKFGDGEAAKFASQVYILRQTQAATAKSGFARFPRSVVILLAVWFALLETADKLPQLLLSVPKFEADLAEYEAKPELTRAGLEKATQDAASAHAQSCLAQNSALIFAFDEAEARQQFAANCSDYEERKPVK
jgi:hypothetical protein